MDFKNEIAKLISYKAGVDLEDVISGIEIPPNREMGDYAFPCFRLSKVMRKSPNVIAASIAEELSSDSNNVFVDRIEQAGAYVNFFVNREVYVRSVISNILDKKDNYGDSNLGEQKTVVIDYSAPNIAKPFHVGHLRSTVIGNALYKIHSKLGYKCVGINYLGDWGTQFGKLITAYKMWGDKETVDKGDIKELTKLYVRFHEEAEKDETLNDVARNNHLKMQDGDEENLSLWKWFQELSMKEFKRVYKTLNVEFDLYQGESYYNDKMGVIIDKLREKNLLQLSEGATVVNLDDANMPPCLILRSDGGTLYATRDITAAIDRAQRYDFCKCIYVTALDQSLHFAQLFKVLDKMGYEWAKNLVHVPFGLVSMETGKLATRTGNVVLMEDILTDSIEKTLNIINEKNPSLAKKEEVAQIVGVGAIIFNDLYNGRIKDVIFSWNRILNFDGETGPYVQYTHARANSVIAKAGELEVMGDIDYSLLRDDASFEVCKVLQQYPDRLKDSADRYEPSIIARFIVTLSQEFNKFYHDNPILKCEGETKKARLALTLSVKTVLANALSLLGIGAPDNM